MYYKIKIKLISLNITNLVEPKISLLRMIFTSDLFERIKLAQEEALKEENWKIECILSQIPYVVDDSRGIETRFGRVVRSEIKYLLLEEAHKLKYLIHPGVIKMYLI